MNRKNQKDFNHFQSLAKDEKLSKAELLDFPNELRQGFENLILLDLKSKIPALQVRESRILDIGCGCGDLALKIIENSQKLSHELHLIDGKDVLQRLPSGKKIQKHFGRFQEQGEVFSKYREYFDVILCYSVFQYIALDSSPMIFLDRCLELLKSGGMLLIGDIPNISMRNRMLSSEYGRIFHKEYMNSDLNPDVKFFENYDEIDDSIIIAMVLRARNLGYQGYILPQSKGLAFENRREDLLFVKY